MSNSAKVPASATQAVAEPKTNQNGAETASSEAKPATLEVIPARAVKDVSSVLERLDKANELADYRAEFKKKLDHVEKFRRSIDGTGLQCTVTNAKGEDVEFTHQTEIIAFVDSQIQKGREHLAKIEADLCSYEL